MKITRTLISAASACALCAGSVAPVLAYGDFTPPVATTTLRQRSQIRELYADAYSSILELANMHRSTSISDTTGRSLLARAQVRSAQRNFRRHVLGYLRGVDYRVLNVSGDMRRRGVVARTGNLPFRLVQTGGDSGDNGTWGWDRPTRRDIRENNTQDGVYDRNRDILSEIANSSR